MRIYLAAAMTNPARDQPAVAALLTCLEAQGCEVPSRHVADLRGRASDARLSDREVAERDLEWIGACDALVAEVSAPSHGVGVEVATAAALGKPVLLVHRSGLVVSRLLLGLPGVEIVRYSTAEDIARAVHDFLANVAAARVTGGAP